MYIIKGWQYFWGILYIYRKAKKYVVVTFFEGDKIKIQKGTKSKESLSQWQLSMEGAARGWGVGGTNRWGTEDF